MNYSESQKTAINMVGTNALVFASAGAGKTTVLVARLTKRILKDGLSLKEIVAMTFTEAAAATMKKRLRASLIKERKDTDDPVIIDRLENELANLEDSAITTIHAFCLKLIKDNYHLLDISPDRLEHIIDEGTIKVVKDRLLQEIIDRRLAEGDTTFKSFSDAISNELFSFDTIKKAILDVYDTAMNKPDPSAWLESLREEDHYKTFSDLNKEVMSHYINEVHYYIKELAFTYHDITGLLKLQKDENWEAFELKAQAFESLLNEDDYPYLLSKLTTEITAIPEKRKNEEYKLLRERAKSIINDLTKKVLVDPVLALKVENMAISYHNIIIDMTEELIEAYDRYKNENGYVDFNDFEHLAYKLLTVDDKKLTKKLQARYKEIMIDEFQDTSAIQYAIAELIAKDDLFLVGDFKQSIYRFRAARPEIMQSLKSRDDFNVIHIQENYRSSDFLVNFNNALFTRLMTDSFKEEDKQIAPLETQKTSGKRVLFHYIKNPDDSRLSKARLLYQEIEALHKTGIAYKDICVLVRDRYAKLPIKQVFDAMDIPYHMKESEGLFKSYTVEVLQAYIHYLLDEEDDVALMSILSSLYDYSDDDLVRVYKDKKVLEDTPFKEDVKKMRELFDANDIYGFFEYFMGIGDFYITKLDSKERANLDYLISSIEGYAISSLTDLYTYITEAGEQVTAFDLSDEADVVKVMTIHNSKGLEFDHVFLYSQSENKAKERNKALITDDDLGLGLRFSIDERRVTANTLRRLAITYKLDAEDLAEYGRLLYVALTRAKKGLYIIDTIKESKTKDSQHNLIRARKGFTSYIMTLMQDSDLIDFIEHPDITNPLIPIRTKKKTEIQTQLKYPKTKEVKNVRPSDHGLHLFLEENKGMAYGTKIHHILEKIDLRQMDKEHILDIDKDVEPSIIQSIERLSKDPLWQEAMTGEIYRELPFYLRGEDTNSEGIMDLVSILYDKIILIDYKSDHLDDPSVFIERYRRQLTIYHDILKKAYDKKVESYIYSFHLGQFISVD